MQKSKIDNLFFDLYGYYPNKAGQAYEMIVSACFKLLYDENIEYDKHIKGEYSLTDYQLDGYVNNEHDKSMIEAKDYTIQNKKVGRDDVQKLQGALSDLNIKKGLFASATEYTNPAKKYADSSKINPYQKEIELVHIRPSTEEDENGRIKKITLKLHTATIKYDLGKYQPIFTKEGLEKIQENIGIGNSISIKIDNFFDSKGNITTSIYELSTEYPPSGVFVDEFVARGTWLLPDEYLKIEESLYSIKGIEYEVPYSYLKDEVIIQGGGDPKIYIKSENGTINKLITDADLKKVKFIDGKVQIGLLD